MSWFKSWILILLSGLIMLSAIFLETKNQKYVENALKCVTLVKLTWGFSPRYLTLKVAALLPRWLLYLYHMITSFRIHFMHRRRFFPSLALCELIIAIWLTQVELLLYVYHLVVRYKLCDRTCSCESDVLLYKR